MTTNGMFVSSTDIAKSCPVKACERCRTCNMHNDTMVDCWANYAFRHGGHLFSNDISDGIGDKDEEVQADSCRSALESIIVH